MTKPSDLRLGWISIDLAGRSMSSGCAGSSGISTWWSFQMEPLLLWSRPPESLLKRRPPILLFSPHAFKLVRNSLYIISGVCPNIYGQFAPFRNSFLVPIQPWASQHSTQLAYAMIGLRQTLRLLLCKSATSGTINLGARKFKLKDTQLPVLQL